MATEAERVLIAVADAGPGAPCELRRDSFDSFFTTNVLGQGNLPGRAR
jgi:C4-dicarboxylate-specific signal transduction histidine kinase